MYSDVINKVAKELQLPEELVDKTYKAYWLFIRSKIQELPLNQDISYEDFNSLSTNFNIPSLGKLSCTYDKLLGVKKRFQIINNLKSKSNVED